VPLADIAATVGTPFYCYSTATLTRHYRLFTEALSPLPHLVCFAIKSLSNVAVLKTLGDLGAGMDVVSGGEYLRAKAAGVPGDRIVFSGVGKTRDEMRLALEGGIRQFNVESEPELRALSEVATAMGATAPITIRVNPDVDAKTHEKIATGKKENKFGIPIDRAPRSMPRPPACRACGHRHRRAHRQPVDRSGTLRAGLSQGRRPDPRLRAEGHVIAGSIWAAGLAFPTPGRTRRRPCPPTMAR
jgi:diaminopimelate decarboxylase